MARVEHDSQLEFVLHGPSPNDPFLAGDGLPVLDLTSQGPLPFELDTLAPAELARNAKGSKEKGPISHLLTKSQQDVYLEGDVLLCPCPDCQAPMSVRLWLMVADCWQCGTSIELTEQQERAARDLISQRGEKPTPAHAPIAPKSTPLAHSTPGPSPRPPRTTGLPRRETQSPPQQATTQPKSPPSRARAKPTLPSPPASGLTAAGEPLAGRQKKKPSTIAVGSTRVWTSDLFRDMPAWLVSLVFHLVVLTLLGLMTFEQDHDPRQITLSLAVSSDRRQGDAEAWLATDELQFDLPIPRKDRPTNRRELRAMIEANQAARQLRIDPESNDPNLPDLSRVKQLIASSRGPRRSLATRDPRVRTEMLRREGGTTWTEAAVARGLHWMAVHQNSDGSWSLDRFHRHPACRGHCSGRGHISSNAAATSLVLLPFLGAGQTHLTGLYRDHVSAGLRWLLEHQDGDGDLRAGAPHHAGMYVHGQAAIVLCEAFAMTRDETLRRPAQQAVDFIVRAQHPGGGWRYQPGQQGDTSVLGWQLMALQSARAAGLKVPEETLELAGHFLDRVEHDDGALYAYQPRNRPSPAMTAEGLLCRIYLGWGKDDFGLARGIDSLLQDHMPTSRHPNFYYWYYATQVMHHFGSAQWDSWNMAMRDVLVSTQETRGHEAGSWAPRGGHAHVGGRLYSTALAVCCLEVYYRHAPIFRQIKLQ